MKYGVTRIIIKKRIVGMTILLTSIPVYSTHLTDYDQLFDSAPISEETEPIYRKFHHKPKHTHKPLNNAQSQPGSLNQAFGQGGLTTADFGGNHDNSEISGLEILPTQSTTPGEIITIGNNVPGADSTHNKLILASFHSDGRLNTRFGNNGHIELQGDGTPLNTVATLRDFIIGDTGTGSFLVNRSGAGNWQSGFIRQLSPTIVTPRAQKTDHRQRIITGGFVGGNNLKIWALKRTFADGTVDESFGTNGIVTLSFSGEPNNTEEIHGVALTPDDRIIAVGQTQIQGNTSWVVAKFTQQGALDNTFGVGGKVETSFASITGNDVIPNDSANAVVIQPDGKIVVVGYTPGSRDAGGVFLALARYLPNGQLDDRAFGANGLIAVRLGSNAAATAVTLDSQGKILIAGTSRNFVGNSNAVAYQFMTARFNQNGSFDNSYGDDGTVITAFPDTPSDFPTTDILSQANALEIDLNGHITVAGFTHDKQSKRISAIASYNS